jgi:hypothetical protein
LPCSPPTTGITRAIATQTGIAEIMTVDRNDFDRYRLPDGRAFQAI